MLAKSLAMAMLSRVPVAIGATSICASVATGFIGAVNQWGLLARCGFRGRLPNLDDLSQPFICAKAAGHDAPIIAAVRALQFCDGDGVVLLQRAHQHNTVVVSLADLHPVFERVERKVQPVAVARLDRGGAMRRLVDMLEIIAQQTDWSFRHAVHFRHDGKIGRAALPDKKPLRPQQ